MEITGLTATCMKSEGSNSKGTEGHPRSLLCKLATENGWLEDDPGILLGPR